MTNGKVTNGANKGDGHTVKKIDKKNRKKNVGDDSDSVSDISYDSEDVKTLQDLEKKFEEKLKFIEAKHEAKLETLH